MLGFQCQQECSERLQLMPRKLRVGPISLCRVNVAIGANTEEEQVFKILTLMYR